MFTALIAIFMILNSSTGEFIDVGGTRLPSKQIVSQKVISLENRYQDRFVNSVFKDNILLNLRYLKGDVKSKKDINWSQIVRPFKFELKLGSDEVFSFHDDVLPQFQKKKLITTGAHFNSLEGFKSDGFLVGDGVCHLASIIYWAAKSAGLTALAPTNHNFRSIPEVPKDFGVAIYYNPGEKSSNQLQNLYIVNDKNTDISFLFEYDGTKLLISVLELI
ncbi:MAG: hypothetical protein UT63_C0007G0020 [Candidatus Gottesmanbacteria bacterium GW2011_GWC2_39_8]|uniref:VanW family protein n=1 Tax=Candidatus Gottesmanbacteria bacterium GW2011_GWC2_39_8 TaxID=1618450 RepID=A0A0G0SH60_9BACT|nr:MAG: hypothetical protein UT63_C0007G0020 [Candidatus Gottesmanbacteria bacterium GW2011_GWC2_39_8]